MTPQKTKSRTARKKKSVKPYTRMSKEELRALPLPQQRVIIAKDVLSLLRSRKISPVNGSYIETTVDFRYDEEANERDGDVLVIDLIREDWSKKQSYCQVCQIGSLFIGALDLFNSLKLQAIDRCEPGGKDMISYLSGWWTRQELRIMELAFEGGWQGESHEMYDENGHMLPEINRAHEFHDKHGRGEDCMITILKNIIKNDGKFVP
jgi:hypothetical protein